MTLVQSISKHIQCPKPSEDEAVLADANVRERKDHQLKSIQVSDAFAEVCREIELRRSGVSK